MNDLAELTRVVRAGPAPAVTTAGEPIIVTAGLEKVYARNSPVLRGVDMTIRQGERVALIGANGCGKSTLLKCLIGLHPATRGTVITLGERFDRAPGPAQLRRIRRRTGFVFQKHCLVRRRSVLSNVIHGMLGQAGSWRAFDHSLAPDAWRRAALDALAEVNLANFAERRADALSGGQQQRVAIARALIRRPKLLIADEPAASLDPVSGRDVMKLFTRLCHEHGITLLFTSHDMDHARKFSDRTVALRAGRIFLDRPSREVTDRDIEDVFHA